MNKVLWGTKKGAQEWDETVLLEGKTTLSNAKLLVFAKKKFKNYTNFRIMIDNGSLPNFPGVIR